MDRINSLIVRLNNRREEGQGMVEYTLVLALISVIAIAALTGIGGYVGSLLDGVSTVMGNVPVPA
jgi:Flp pilus assembly pilin Flp